jgi:hypothetical protein
MPWTPRLGAVTAAPAGTDEAGEVVLGYCAAVRGILNDDQGGPRHPAGCTDERGVTGSTRVAGAQPASAKRGRAELLLQRLVGCIDRGLEVAREALQQVAQYGKDLQAVDRPLRPSEEATGEEREGQFVSLRQA